MSIIDKHYTWVIGFNPTSHSNIVTVSKVGKDKEDDTKKSKKQKKRERGAKASETAGLDEIRI